MECKKVLQAIESMLSESEAYKKRTGDRKKWRISDVCNELSIFDWWAPFLSVSQLKQMRSFLKTVIQLGFTGHCEFKVGVTGAANGMWAYKEQSQTGYSPDGEAVYHSFVSNRNYWDLRSADCRWLAEYNNTSRYQYTLKEIKQYIKEREIERE